MTRSPDPDVYTEAMALLAAATERELTLKAIGGLAVKIACPSASKPPLERDYKDIDLVGLSAQRESVESLFLDLGYASDHEFNLLNGDVRLYYWDAANDRQIDVFLDRMEMCHTLELAPVLESNPLTVPPTDLLLSKLQVYETNERDLKDAAALLLDCDVDDGRIAELLASDWGWWKTVNLVLDRLADYASATGNGLAGELLPRIDRLRGRIEAEPKSRRWKLRGRIGERKRWYALPEEDHVEG